MKKNLLIVALVAIVFTSCISTSKTIRFNAIPDETVANENLKNFFRSNPKPSILLRVPNSNDRASSNTSADNTSNLLFNAIEKEFLKTGFSVRDRGLFNEVLSKGNISDYSKIKELTNTDIIVEIANINLSVDYTTNRFTEKIGNKVTEKVGNYSYTEKGASVEYKIILVRTNEVAGAYKFNYQPCPNGCVVQSFNFSTKRKIFQPVLKETVEINAMEEFIKHSTQKLISSFKQ
ncbi:MAG: hypothetical protein NVV59_07035 [Chitinophagaceae bacterium]|nr:hypothetical protein [Chitinophagaceae bacterium]